MSLCRCGHPADTHLHYRDGTDCGACGHEACGAFVPDAFTDDQALAYVALAPYALPSELIAENPMTGRHGDDDSDGLANQADPDWRPDQRDEHAHDDQACDQAQTEPDRWLGVTRDPDELEQHAAAADG